MRFEITLVNLKTNDTRSGTYSGANRHECVSAAYTALIHRERYDVLDEWKVLATSQCLEDGLTCAGMERDLTKARSKE